MDVGDIADCFQLVRDLSQGITVLRDFAGGPNEIYIGVAASWNADTTTKSWWIVKNTFDATNIYNTKTQISPPNQIWDLRASVFP